MQGVIMTAFPIWLPSMTSLPTPPLLNLIGPGKVGLSLAQAWLGCGAIRLGSVLASQPAHAQAAVARLGAGQAVSTLAELGAAELTLIASPDGRIADLAGQLAAAQVLRPGSGVWHASGALAAEQLAPLAEQGIRLASAHPVMSFANPERAQASLPGMPVALEGDATLCQHLAQLFAQLGARPFTLAPGAKAGYHAALSMASNYLITLVALASQTLQQAGVAAAACPDLLAPLMRHSLDNALALGPAAALTGPIVRGDAATVAAHLAVLDQPICRQAYLALGQATLDLAAERLPAAAQQAVSAVLAAAQR